jgi:hypothetical protein
MLLKFCFFLTLLKKNRAIAEQLNTRKRWRSRQKRHITVPCGPLCRTFIYTYGRQSTYVTQRLRDL